MNHIWKKAIVLLLLAGLMALGVATAGAQDDLTGVEWQWTNMTDSATGETTTVAAPGQYTLNFAGDGTVSGRADCNNYTGTYTQDGDALDITLGAMTLVACAEGSQEAIFRQTLDGVVAGARDGDTLTLRTADDAQSMVFQAAGAAGTDTTAVQDDAAGGFLGLPWWAWLLLGLLLLLLLWWLFGRRRPVPPPPPEPPQRMTTAEPPPPAATPEAGARVYPAQSAAPEPPPPPVMPEPTPALLRDDLKRIEGIGPRIEGILNDAGITTFAALSAVTAERLREILNAADLRGSFGDPTSWPEQARLAAEGKWAELQDMQNRLKGGR
jgi:heat shock protein HslJ/predicted flap endonuclease-1-like 5' DNA nuclease